MIHVRPEVRVLDHGKPPTVCLDFDGVIHEYRGWNGPVPTGRLLDGAREAILDLKQAGARVEVFSTRPRANIQDFLTTHRIHVDEVRDGKPYYIRFFDDRASNVPANQPDGLYTAVHRWLAGQGGDA